MAKRRAKWNDAMEVAFEATARDFVVPLNFVPIKWSVNGVFEAPETTGSGWFAPASVADDENLYVQAAKAKLAEIEAKKSPVPAKSGPPELILDEPQRAASEPKTRVGWADEIAHEIAEAEKAWDEAYRDAHGEHLQRHPELMVAACEEMLVTKDFGDSIKVLADRYLPGFERREKWMFGLMQFFALDCLVPVDAKEMRQELMQKSLTSLLRLAKAVNWGQPFDSKDWTG